MSEQPTIEGGPLDVLDRLDAYTTFDAETCFLFVRKLDGATVARADWVRDGEAMWATWRDARAEIERLRAEVASLRLTLGGRTFSADIPEPIGCPIPGMCVTVEEIRRLRALLARYRDETPLGHQPHMIAAEVDAALGRPA